MKQYRVELTSEERSQLQQIVTKGNTAGYRMNRPIFCSKPTRVKTVPAGLIQRLPGEIKVSEK